MITAPLVTTLVLMFFAAARADADMPSIQDATHACPMDTHPDETDPAQQGAYLADAPGRCPWCGMALKPIEELAWARARRAAGDAEVAYTCPDHPHVFAAGEGACPRCERALEPFKVMYTCPDPKHANVVRDNPGECPHDRRPLAAFRGIWLSEAMAAQNAPRKGRAAPELAYRCPVHPVAGAGGPGNCPICAEALRPAADAAPLTIPADANYVCPMQECEYFAPQAGSCPVCGMRIRPIEQVPWAAELRGDR